MSNPSQNRSLYTRREENSRENEMKNNQKGSNTLNQFVLLYERRNGTKYFKANFNAVVTYENNKSLPRKPSS